MASTLASLLPMIIGSALVPVQIILVLLILTSKEKPILKGVAFVSGMTVARLVQGLLFGFVFTSAAGEGGADSGPRVIASTLLLTLGVLLLVTAYRKFIADDDPDAPPPKWLAMAGNMSVTSAFLTGLALIAIAAKLWVFTLGALGAIAADQLGQPASTITFLLYVLLAQSLLITPILVRTIVPNRADAWLKAASGWLNTHNRVIVIIVSTIFGLFFLYQGITGLLS